MLFWDGRINLSSESPPCLFLTMLVPQTELGVLTFFPRLKSGWSLKFVDSYKNHSFFNKHDNFCHTSPAILIPEIVDPPFLSYVPSDIDIDFFMIFTFTHKPNEISIILLDAICVFFKKSIKLVECQ